MGKFLIVSQIDRIEEYKKLADQYGVGFEVNDFYNPVLLEKGKEQDAAIAAYEKHGLPEGSTMHGAFYDITLFSYDPEIRRISRKRMRQSMDIARRLKVKGVVFHTNGNPLVGSGDYDTWIVDETAKYMEKLLKQYPDIEIYLENMFDDTPEILRRISEKLQTYSNYGVCLDYAHACVFGHDFGDWVKQLSPYVRHLHINDNDLRRDLHLAVGAGLIDWEQFRAYYLSHFQDCTVLVETTEPEAQRKSLESLISFGILKKPDTH